MTGLTSSSFRTLPSEFRTALHAFAQSPSNFRILRTLRLDSPSASPRASSSPCSPLPSDLLYVLDSSFNPPTLGHLNIALSALREASPATRKSRNLLLLLATQNADKAAKPAAFEQRLTMMAIMAEKILSEFRSDGSSPSSSSTGEASSCALSVSIGVTKFPYFVDKSNAVAHEPDSPFTFPPTRQVHLIGFDTFTRLFDTRYYPPDHTLAPLEPLFADHSVRVTFRAGDKYGSKEEQEQYVRDIASGKRDSEGAKSAWADKVSMVEGRNDEMVTSSTTARKAVKSADEGLVRQMCGAEIAEWLVSEKLYTEDVA